MTLVDKTCPRDGTILERGVTDGPDPDTLECPACRGIVDVQEANP